MSCSRTCDYSNQDYNYEFVEERLSHSNAKKSCVQRNGTLATNLDQKTLLGLYLCCSPETPTSYRIGLTKSSRCANTTTPYSWLGSKNCTNGRPLGIRGLRPEGCQSVALPFGSLEQGFEVNLRNCSEELPYICQTKKLMLATTSATLQVTGTSKLNQADLQSPGYRGGQTSHQSSDSYTPGGAIAGAVVGAIVLALLIFLLLVCRSKKNRSKTVEWFGCREFTCLTPTEKVHTTSNIENQEQIDYQNSQPTQPSQNIHISDEKSVHDISRLPRSKRSRSYVVSNPTYEETNLHSIILSTHPINQNDKASTNQYHSVTDNEATHEQVRQDYETISLQSETHASQYSSVSNQESETNSSNVIKNENSDQYQIVSSPTKPDKNSPSMQLEQGKVELDKKKGDNFDEKQCSELTLSHQPGNTANDFSETNHLTPANIGAPAVYAVVNKKPKKEAAKKSTDVYAVVHKTRKNENAR